MALRKSRKTAAPLELFTTDGNPLPPDGVVAPVRTYDGLRLRSARWSIGRSRGTILIAIGRSEFIEEYFEVVRALLERRFDVVIFDWRGQGQSERESAYARRGHVSNFAAYRRDLAAVEAQILRPFAPRPWFALAHSMGAAILLDQAHDGTSPFERIVMTAPMIKLPLRYGRPVRWLVRAADSLGFGGLLIPRGDERPVFTQRFEDNILTGDARQHARIARVMTQLPHLAVGAPTIRWLAGAFDLMERFEKPLFALETLVPILVIAAGADRIVDTAAINRFAINLKCGHCLTIPAARHQIMMERPGMVAQFWAAFDAFVPGQTVKQDQLGARPRPSGFVRGKGVAFKTGLLQKAAGLLGRR